MSTVANPLFSSLVPGMNPTGSQISLGGSMPNTPPGANALLPNVNPSPSSSGAGPMDVVPGSSTTPAFPANGPGPTNLLTPPAGPQTNVGTAAQSPIGGINLASSKDLSRLFDSLKKTYGDGAAHLLLNFLTTGAGFNQDAINNLFASLQPQIERGTENLMSQFSASGNRFGSSAAIGLGDYLSQVNLNEGQLETQMYEQAINDYLNVLMGTSNKGADRIAASPTGLDSVLSGLGIGGATAGALGSATGSSTLSTIGQIAGAAAFA